LCELFDGDAPHRPGGTIAAAIAVAEVLRCYAQDVLNKLPHPGPAVPVALQKDPFSPA